MMLGNIYHTCYMIIKGCKCVLGQNVLSGEWDVEGNKCLACCRVCECGASGMLVCSICANTWYCSRACQRRAKKTHKCHTTKKKAKKLERSHSSVA
jgi:hypothetical protein